MKITIKKFIIFFIFPMEVNPILIFIFLIYKYFHILELFLTLLIIKIFLVFYENIIFMFKILKK